MAGWRAVKASCSGGMQKGASVVKHARRYAHVALLARCAGATEQVLRRLEYPVGVGGAGFGDRDLPMSPFGCSVWTLVRGCAVCYR